MTRRQASCRQQQLLQASSQGGREWRRQWQRTAVRESQISGENCDFARDQVQTRIEAILFLAREPLTSRKIALWGNLPDGTAARTVMLKLNRYYDASGSPFRIEEIAGGYQLFTRPMLGTWLRKLATSSQSTAVPESTIKELRLSAPALETLAVVAYRQPILRAEVEAIRGVQCGDLLRQLLERDFIRISGRAEDLGRPLMYGTTKRFLQVFGLRHLDELPRAEQLRIRPVTNGSSEQTAAGQPATADQTLTVNPNFSASRFQEEELS